MEFASNSSAFGMLVVTLVVLGLTKLVASAYEQFTYWRKRGVPHVRTIPFFGNAWQLLFERMTLPDYIKSVYNSHADTKYVGFMDFSNPTVLMRDPELIREMGIKHFNHFTDRRSFANEAIEPLLAKSLFALKGDRWKKMRNTMTPIFTSSKMKFMFGLFNDCSHDFFGHLYNHPELCAMVDAKETFKTYACDVFATSLFGISVNTLKERNNEFYREATEVNRSLNSLNMFKFALLRACPRLCQMLGMRVFPRSTVDFLHRVVADTVRIRREKGIVRPDMIHLMMQIKEEQNSEDITIEDMVAQAFGFFIAGFDTVSTIMSFLTFEMALNQDIQTRLREETDRYLAEDNGKISYEALSKMEYMDMVVSETLRKHAVVPFLDRLCVEQFELPAAGPGYKSVTINPGDALWIPTFALNNDPEYFPNPEKFDPERFSEENKARIAPYTFLPFGIGPRMCIGNRFALMEIKIMMVYLLQKFVIEPNEKTKPLLSSRMNFQMLPLDGFWYTLKKRDV
ncbi:cytochrome P450 9e2 [Megalopta genalis]|uniref:cytochrome P450 9e2 n=1 Tax=Megalopta genalis TaxID=115081 RepID=UPI003FD4BA30